MWQGSTGISGASLLVSLSARHKPPPRTASAPARYVTSHLRMAKSPFPATASTIPSVDGVLTSSVRYNGPKL
ncbi:hypothetical protein BJ956_001315 [Arthrobacter psychrochitiniphilus]|nr:hypothetical protein [Arthrobacter psychrochitiniphilus]